jgi:hypothetical protein
MGRWDSTTSDRREADQPREMVSAVSRRSTTRGRAFTRSLSAVRFVLAIRTTRRASLR